MRKSESRSGHLHKLKKKRKPVGDCQGWSQCFTGAVTYGKFSILSLSNSVTSTLLGYSPLVYMSE